MASQQLRLAGAMVRRTLARIRSYGVLVAFVSAFSALGAIAASAAEPLAGRPSDTVVVTVDLDELAAISPADLAQARALVTEIYGRAGVRLQWQPPAMMSMRASVPPNGLTLVIAVASRVSPSTRQSAASAQDVMGVAPLAASAAAEWGGAGRETVRVESSGIAPRSSRAFVFSDRVLAFAGEHRLAVPIVLACALAHEIGHLLLPAGAHADFGIMRSTWYPALFPPHAPGLPGFTPEQVRLLRRRVADRALVPVTSVSSAAK